jgi:hypothetical protein
MTCTEVSLTFRGRKYSLKTFPEGMTNLRLWLMVIIIIIIIIIFRKWNVGYGLDRAGSG